MSTVNYTGFHSGCFQYREGSQYPFEFGDSRFLRDDCIKSSDNKEIDRRTRIAWGENCQEEWKQ